jgi:hypothetical protein
MAMVTSYAAILAMAGCLTLAAVGPTYAQRTIEPDCIVDVAVSAGPTLDVAFHCRTTKAITFAPNDEVVARQVQDFRDGDGNELSPSNSEWIVEPTDGFVTIRYLYDLAAYAREVDSTSNAVLRGDGVLAELAGWLLVPNGFQSFPVIDIRARTAKGQSFAMGLPKIGDAWRLSHVGVDFAGYTAVGKFSLQEIAVPAPGLGEGNKDGILSLAILDGISEPDRAELTDWVRRTVEAEVYYWRGFTAPQLLLGLVPMGGRHGVGFGRTEAAGGATVMVEVGTNVDQRQLFNDWVLVHELIHTGMPYIGGNGTWFMEGAATYVEPIIRARAGWKSEEAIWKEWLDNMPQGVEAFSKGLSNASGRENYWGGALFMLMADLAIRRETKGQKGLEDCLGGALWAGHAGSTFMSLKEYVAVCDRLTGTKNLSTLVARHYNIGAPIDLAAFWHELGVSEVAGRVALDDSAPQAQWRKMIVMGPSGGKLRAVRLPWQS